MYWQDGIPLAHLLAKDGQVDDAEWSYIFDLHRAHPCVVCLLELLQAPNHGSPELRDERFFAALRVELERARSPSERRPSVAELMPLDGDFTAAPSPARKGVGELSVKRRRALVKAPVAKKRAAPRGAVGAARRRSGPNPRDSSSNRRN